MTTLIALSTKDSLVLGCDSLGTATKSLVDPFLLLEYFAKDFKLKKDKDGNPVLKEFLDIWRKSWSVPYEHMTHMTKLFSLSPLPMGIMCTGITSVGDLTIKTLIEECKTKEAVFWEKPRSTNYTVKAVANKVLAFISGYFEKEYPDEKRRPHLEFILGGYDKRSPIPKIVRITLPERKIEECHRKERFGIVFGGQMKEIQRIVHGTDFSNWQKIRKRHSELLNRYRDKINSFLKEHNISVSIPELAGDEEQELDMSRDKWVLDGFDANWGDFSEQNAIECVDFFVNIMIKSQQFSTGMPTVGGEVHIALITKTDGFRFISREEYRHEGHFLPKRTPDG